MHKILLLLIAFSSCTNESALVEVPPQPLKTPLFHVTEGGRLVCDNADEDLFFFDVNVSAPPEEICGWNCVDHPVGRGHFHIVKYTYADGAWWLGVDQQAGCHDDCLWWDRRLRP